MASALLSPLVAQHPGFAEHDSDAAAGSLESFSIARAAHGLNVEGGQIVGGGGDYKVLFGPGSVTFTPALGTAVAVNQELSLSLESIRRGGTTVYEPPGAIHPDATRSHANIAQYRHGNVIEQYEIRADEMEQSFVFARQPIGSGDLVVRLRVDTNMTAAAGERLTGLQFRAGELAAVDIGAVLGVDATGRSAAGFMNYTGSHLELVLPDAFVASASYPLVLDPPIGTSSVLAGGGAVRHLHPDVAYEPNSDVYLVVWEKTYSSGDDDVQGQRVDSAGQLVGGLLNIDTRNTRETDPTVCAVAASGKFVVAWERDQHSGPFTQDVVGRTVDAATGSMGPWTDLAAEFTDELNPSLGGDSSGQDNECVLVFESFGQAILWREITVSTTGTLTEVVSRRRNVGPIPTPAIFGVDHTPEVSKDAGAGGRFLVAWIGTDPETFVYFRFLDRNSNFLSGVGGLAGTRMRNPQVSGDGVHFALAYERASGGPAQDIWGIELAVPAVASSSPLGFNHVALETGNFDDDTAPAIALEGDRFVLAISDALAPPDGPQLWGATVQTSTMTRCGGWTNIGVPGSLQHNLESAVAAKTPNPVATFESLIVFRRETRTPSGSTYVLTSSDIRGVRWTNGQVCPGAATSTAFGSGCGDGSRAFYELTPGSGFDLSGNAMRLVNNGMTYTAQTGGAFVAPSASATTLTLGLDDEQTVNLIGSFPYHGGTTTSLVVCSNGFVSTATGNGVDYTPTAAEWLAGSQPRWGSWHDFNLPVGGSVKFEQVGSIAYVTWDGAYSYATTDANTWQLQFDLATGNVSYVWQSVIASGGDWLVGYSSGTGDLDAGNMDISSALPGTFRTSAENSLALELDATEPVLGTNCVLTTTQISATAVLALQTLSLTKIDPGIDLGFLGMPGCRAYAGLDVIYTMIPVSGQASHLLPIPNQASLIGFELAAQSSVFAPTANAFGFVNSNGVSLVLGS